MVLQSPPHCIIYQKGTYLETSHAHEASPSTASLNKMINPPPNSCRFGVSFLQHTSQRACTHTLDMRERGARERGRALEGEGEGEAERETERPPQVFGLWFPLSRSLFRFCFCSSFFLSSRCLFLAAFSRACSSSSRGAIDEDVEGCKGNTRITIQYHTHKHTQTNACMRARVHSMHAHTVG